MEAHVWHGPGPENDQFLIAQQGRCMIWQDLPRYAQDYLFA
jgi:hypothetical protein